MALSHQPERRVLILQPTNAEVSTNQVYATRYEWRVDGELTLPIPTVIDSLKHTDAEFSIYRVDVSVNIGGTSQYELVIKSYDTAGLNPITHVDQFISITGNKNRISVPVLNGDVPQNRSLEVSLYQSMVGTPAIDMTVTMIAEDFASTSPLRLGHRIIGPTDIISAQEPDIKFSASGAGMSSTVTDDPSNSRTIVNYALNMGFIGQYLESDLTLAQHQALYGSGWVLADGTTSCVGSTYGTITSRTVVPDARGIFLRGKNNSRTDGHQNPDGDLALGTYSADKFASHTHNIRQNTQDTANSLSVAGGTSHDFDQSTDATGGNETAPKSITVNIFIKIN